MAEIRVLKAATYIDVDADGPEESELQYPNGEFTPYDETAE
jgi:hypothetical protein